MIAPVDLSGSNIAIEVTDNKGNTYGIANDQYMEGKELAANKIYSFTCTMAVTETSSSEQVHATEPYFSEMVELMGLLWRLAGADEYNFLFYLQLVLMIAVNKSCRKMKSS